MTEHYFRCVNHFACSSCDQKMTVKTKFYEVDLKPVCKKCYDRYGDFIV